MAKKTLDITTREQLDVYMNPQRQRLLHEMQVLAQPSRPHASSWQMPWASRPPRSRTT